MRTEKSSDHRKRRGLWRGGARYYVMCVFWLGYERQRYVAITDTGDLVQLLINRYRPVHKVYRFLLVLFLWHNRVCRYPLASQNLQIDSSSHFNVLLHTLFCTYYGQGVVALSCTFRCKHWKSLVDHFIDSPQKTLHKLCGMSIITHIFCQIRALALHLLK